jgi:thiamine biosynthesis protein ThiS
MVPITVNGEPRSCAEGSSIVQLLETLGLHPRLVVVEHNRVILRREQLDEVEVREGDEFELVHFVGGG